MDSNGKEKENIHPQELRKIIKSKAKYVSGDNNRRAFVENNVDKSSCSENEMIEKQKRRRISFKINQQQRLITTTTTTTTTLSANKVTQLTKKFNELIEEEPKVARAVIRRANTSHSINTNNHDNNNVVVLNVRRPSVKQKFENHETKKKKLQSIIRRKSSVPKSKPELPSQPNGNVKAAIEIFERRKSEQIVVHHQSTNNNHKINQQQLANINVPKPKIAEKKNMINSRTKEIIINKDGVRKLKIIQNNEMISHCSVVVKIPNEIEQKQSQLYESVKIQKTTRPENLLKISREQNENQIKPNHSFLWRSKSSCRNEHSLHSYSISIPIEEEEDDYEKIDNTHFANEEIVDQDVYDTVTTVNDDDEDKMKFQSILAKTDEILNDFKTCLEVLVPIENKSKTTDHDNNTSSYEEMSYDEQQQQHRNDDDDNNIYETLNMNNAEKMKQQIQLKPLPDIPPPPDDDEPHNNENIYSTLSFNSDLDYESIYDLDSTPATETTNISLCNRYLLQDDYYYDDDIGSKSNRDSWLSCDQQSNSLYGRYDYGSDLLQSSDEWVDVSDPDSDTDTKFVIVRERKHKKMDWSLKVRDQWAKEQQKVDHLLLDQDTSSSLDHNNHYYESLNSDDDDFDSFDSGSDDEDDSSSFTKMTTTTTNQNDSGVDMGNSQLPEVPGNIYGLTRLAASAGKHMKRLRRNWSLTKNDITKSLSRMTKKKSTTNLSTIPPASPADTTAAVEVVRPPPPPPLPAPVVVDDLPAAAANLTRTTNSNANASFSRKKNWLKFRRCVSMTSPNESAQSDDARGGIGTTKSTFYLTNEIDVDSEEQIVSSQQQQQEEEPVVPRRRRVKSNVGIRPQSPPPPAPIKRAENIRSSSWYTECGLFKATQQPPSSPLISTSNTCWYAEVGLYEKKSECGASSVENSGDSNIATAAATELYYNMKNNEESVENSIYYNDDDDDEKKTTNYKDEQQMQLMLKDEPLYQFYDAAVAENACLDQSSDSDYDGYEEIGDLLKSSPIPICQSIRSRFSSRTLWCEIPEVIQSEILSSLTVLQKKVQEAKFEVLTSEASYLNSLTVLEEHFVANLLNDELVQLSVADRQVLFGLVGQMKNCSEMLLTELELCWIDGIMLRGVCEAVLKHATQQGHVYVTYCENQVNLEVILRKCKENNKVFADQVQQLESNPRCQGLSLYSFLMLPMQRITRMPLLVDAILKRLTPDDDEFQVCQAALFKLNEVVRRCNEGARNVERQSELKRIAKQLLWPAHIPVISLCNDDNCSRWLVRSGELIHLIARTDEVKLTFGKKFTKIPLTFFLFEDLLIIAKKYSEETFTVIHHCPRNLIELSTSLTSAGDCLSQNRNLLFLTLLENHEARTIELMLSCASETDRQRWIEALSPPRSDNPYETVYESWDCPQVQAVHRYQATQPDELYLMKGDVVNVDKKMLDGWYHGERIRDGSSGWFPGNHTIEIANPHVRARNLKQRYRLLAFTDNYLNKSKS